MNTIRVVLADCSAMWRKRISDALRSVPGVELVSVVGSLALALKRIHSQNPDLMVLDAELFDQENEFRDALSSGKFRMPLILVVNDEKQLQSIIKDMSDFELIGAVEKYHEGEAEAASEEFSRELCRLVKGFSRVFSVRMALRGRAKQIGVPIQGPQSASPIKNAVSDSRLFPACSGAGAGMKNGKVDVKPSHLCRTTRNSRKLKMLLIGVSTGGPEALAVFLPELPEDMPVPVLLVQHMPSEFTGALAASLNRICALKVKEAQKNEIAVPGVVYIAPGGKHMKIVPGRGDQIVIDITNDPPENNCRPSVDYLFRSAAESFPGGACAVIMTGMGADGVQGLQHLKADSNTFVIAQDRETSVVFGMPGEAIAAGLVNRVVPLDRLAQEVIKAIGGNR